MLEGLGSFEADEDLRQRLQQASEDVAAYERGEGEVRYNPEIDKDIYIPPAVQKEDSEK